MEYSAEEREYLEHQNSPVKEKVKVNFAAIVIALAIFAVIVGIILTFIFTKNSIVRDVIDIVTDLFVSII